MYKTLQHDDTLHRMKADLEEARARLKEAEQPAGLRRRGET